ncbi:hypothetical protein Cgig2_009242 [Carnegiea gigantea]|uniref:Reverse transcriptase zinc-binding domain-containing protein n=1 Tax=Carnegiea gigantea TaxID=171969 RepID=A0A9Q1JLH0_9CARY|nr:hypothetical protein Cgig2_009242 [Carnegiea gigantea]
MDPVSQMGESPMNNSNLAPPVSPSVASSPPPASPLDSQGPTNAACSELRCFVAMARGGRKGRAKQARDPVSPEIPVAAQEGTIDLDSTSKGESSNAIVPVTTEVSEIEQLWVPSPNTYDAAFQSNTIKSSYTAIADLDEGTSLNFVHSPMLNGVKCAKIEPQYVQSKIDYWKSVVLCSVIGANPPLEVLEGFVQRIWQACEIDKVCLLQDSFPDFFDFVNEHNVVVRQKVEYEWKPSKCTFCKMFGHTDEECRKKPIPRAEWRPITRQNPPRSSSALAQPSMDAEVLYPGDRMGGTEVQFHEIKNFSDCISTCEVQELKSNGPYYTWTNKTTWTRIDRVFVNTYWYNIFALSHLNYMASSLSDHTVMVLSFPWCPKPKPSFQFCDMWVRDPSFLPLMSTIAEHLVSHDPNTKLKLLLQHAKIALQKLNKDRYADLKTQLSMARADLEKAQMMLSNSPGDIELLHHVEISRAHYIQILSSVIDIIKQQSKADWIGYGDESTRYFFAKIKKRKTDTYILSIQDDQGHTRPGFEEVKEIMGKMRQWSTRNLSFAGRALLINTVVFGMYGFWASIFILPQEVITRINQLCRNFLWGGTADYKRPPLISSDIVCTPKKYGGLEAEDADHLLFQCTWAKEMWQAIKNWWPITFDISSKEAFTRSLIKLKKPRGEKHITYSIAAAVIYNIWRAKNEQIFSNHAPSIQTYFKQTREHIIHRILILRSTTKKFTHSIDILLS